MQADEKCDSDIHLDLPPSPRGSVNSISPGASNLAGHVARDEAVVQYLRKVGEIGPSTYLRRASVRLEVGCGFDCAQGLGMAPPRLSPILHCACMYL